MSVQTYECMLILDSNRFARDQAGVSGQISKFVKNAGGDVLVSRLWEERRLAYPIEGHRKGTYWLSYFKLDSRQVAGLERECQLSESILRSLILKVEPRIADALVSHAKGAGQMARPKPPEAAPVTTKADVPEFEGEGVDAIE
ncbi:MAG: 30S ribosomal protein S6 [Pirellulales bacterium]|nr:30S ribosomal protein S6 [Pirellulales bacterium]